MKADLIITHANIYPDEKKVYQNGTAIINHGRIAALKKDGESYQEYTGEVLDATGLNLLPGFIDVHVHGGFGQEFMSASQENLELFSRKAVSEGTTGFYASLVCASPKQTRLLLQTYAKCHQPANAHWLGVHLEGPYLSKEYKAVMQARYLRNPSMDEFKQLIEDGQGCFKYMTIAPELDGALDIISYGMRNGIGMMLGHSAATSAQAMAGLHAGALGFTHFYNAMTQHEHRHPGMVTAGLMSNGSLCEMITDGYHVDPDVVKATFNCIKAKRIALISDGTLMHGQPDGVYPFSGYEVIKKDGTARLTNGRLAGSVVGMDQIVRQMRKMTNCSLNDIVQMASMNPACLARVGNKKGRLLRGFDADMVLLDEKMEVRQTFVAGHQTYSHR